MSWRYSVLLGILLMAGSCGRVGAPPPVPVSPARTATTPPVAAPALATSSTSEVNASRLTTPTLAARPSPSPTATPAPVEPELGGIVTVGGLGSPATLNPYLDDSQPNRLLTSILYDSLLRVQPDDGRLVPNLAQSVVVSEDGLTLTFRLHPDAVWHDGQPVTAADVVFTLNELTDPPHAHRFWFAPERVLELSAPSVSTVVVRLAEPDCSLLYALGQAPILPRHLLNETGLFDDSFGRQPVGSGPFGFAAWHESGEIATVRNETYWQVPPRLAGWGYRPFDDPVALQMAADSGSIDLAVLPPGAGDGVPGLTRLTYPDPELFFVAFNLNHPLLGRREVRRALAQAIDREQILAESLAGRGLLLAASLPPGHWAAGPELTWPAYDPGQARRLLAQAGLVDSDGDGWLDRAGDPVRLALRTNADNDLRRSLAILVSQYWRQAGLDTTVELTSWPLLVDDLLTHDFDAALFSWPVGPDPDQTHLWQSTEDEIGRGLNVVSFSDVEVDRWLAEGLTAAGCDLAGRSRAYANIQQRLAEVRPYDFLLMPQATVLANPELKGLAAGLWGGVVWNASDWYFEKQEQP
jgi:peptide/nickel transport system substrate-binding protein